MGVGLQRMADQRSQTQGRETELAAALSNGDQPIVELELRLKDFLARRLDIESELATERRALEDAGRGTARARREAPRRETRVNGARGAVEQARMAAQESRVRREGIVEQFAPRVSNWPKSSPDWPRMPPSSPGKSR